MLIQWIIRLFKKYIFNPHVHDWKFDKTFQSNTSVGRLTASRTYSIYICKDCGKIVEVINDLPLRLLIRNKESDI